MSVVTAADVERSQGVLTIATSDVVTPLARDRAKELGIRIERSTAGRSATVQRNGVAGGVAPVEPERIANLPAAVSRSPQRELPRSEPRSGALYRRGGYGLNGERRDAARGTAATAHARPTIAVIGAGHVGAATGIRLAESDAFERLILIDVVDGLAAGLALDMWHSAGLQGFTTRVEGSTQIDAVADADIIVITAGRPRKPGMSRTDLTAANSEIVSAIGGIVRTRAPQAVVVVVTNPLEEMTELTARITGFPPERVIGMGGVLDTARFRSLVGLTGVAQPQDVRAIVLGSHGAEMVIPLSLATANGVPLEQLLDARQLADIVGRTRDSGAEVTRLLQAGSAYVSPGSAIARQIAAIVNESEDVVPACVASGRAYGLNNVRIGLPVRLGRRGIREIVALELRPAELRELRAAGETIGARIAALA